MNNVCLEIPQDVLDSSHLSLNELKAELALALYAGNKLSLGKARELSGLSLWDFRQLQRQHGIPAHFKEGDLEDDLSAVDNFMGYSQTL